MKSALLSAIVLLFCFSSNAYWQQHTVTTIEVRLDDRNHFLFGKERIVYTNHSPDTLKFIYIHLWPNAYKNEETSFSKQLVQQGKTDFYYAPDKERGFIDSLQFTVDGQDVTYVFEGEQIDFARIDLPKILLPGSSITIETPFRVKIPKVFSRLGHTGQAYFISQWFPKPAVYDTKGWHPMSYLDQGEFYSEFGSYDVTISLPENYILMATGNCRTESENSWMDSLGKLPLPAPTFFRNSFPPSSERFKTVRFTEDSVHDFAWFADKRWILRQDTISGDDAEHVIKVFSAFLPWHQSEWATANAILKATVHVYGDKVGKYPYRTIKAVEGDMSAGGGMEYPTITIIDKSVVSELETVIAHEAGHNWFYGILGTNERGYPWMDEGLNSFYERKATNYIRGKDRKPKGYGFENSLYYHLVAGNEDQPLTPPAAHFRSTNYGADVYFKSALLLSWMENYIGEEDFKKGMRAYYNKWKFRHPYPNDFKEAMQSQTSKNLDWFFEALKTDKPVEFKLKKVSSKDGQLIVKVINKSSFPAPVAVSVVKNDSVFETRWTEPFRGEREITVDNISPWKKIVLNENPADLKLSNNTYRRKGILHKGDFEVKPFLGLNRSEKYRLFVCPSYATNFYNGNGVALVFHNLSFPKNRLQFALAPVYSFGSKNLNGVGAVSYSWYPRKVFQEIRIQTNLKSFAQGKTDLNIDDPIFARYIKVAPSVELIFKQKNKLEKRERKLLLKQYNVSEQDFAYKLNPVDSLYRPSIQTKQNTYALIRYEHKHSTTFHPFSYNAEAQFGKNFIKLGLEANAKINYDIKDKSFYMRAYAGKLISTNTSADLSPYYLNATFTGRNDYLLDGTYYGRNENDGFAARQISVQEGGMKIPTNQYINPLGRSDNWLLALNLKTDLPFGKLPLRLYADFVTFANAKLLNPTGNMISYNAGLELYLFYDVCKIYIPLVSSKEYSNYLKEIYGNKKFARSITFAIQLQNFNFLRSNDAVFKLAAP